MTFRLPKVAPDALERARVQAWLTFHERTAVRYVCASAGSGKTTCAVRYARGRAVESAFITLAPGTGAAALIGQLAHCLGFASTVDYAQLVDRLGAVAPLEIIIDDVDAASVDARRLLGRIYLDVPDGVTFVYLARSEDDLVIGDGQVRGLIDVCDPALFAFDTREIGCFAESLSLAESALSYARLREATHGWAIAVCGICRTAAAYSLRLSDALGSWRRLNDPLLRKVVSDALQTASPSAAAEFCEILTGGALPGQQRLEAFRAAGLFVFEWNGRLTINPLLRRGTMASDLISPATIKMFGKFDMSVNGQSVDWIRRRDRQIIQYLAMQPRGRATRADIIANFWPDSDLQLARQSLRSSCSTIRRAIGECVGRANVGRYFVGDHMLELVFDNVVITTREFVQQCDLAESAYGRRDVAAALRHYRKAAALYRSPFLAGEPPASWTTPHEARFAAMRAEAAAKFDPLPERPGVG